MFLIVFSQGYLSYAVKKAPFSTLSIYNWKKDSWHFYYWYKYTKPGTSSVWKYGK